MRRRERWIHLYDPYRYRSGFYAYDHTEECWLWIPKTGPEQVYAYDDVPGWIAWGQ